ncbi:MAG: TonB C-terminal domain-containing protein, partial [Zoogloea oleivorans]|nr:TonB C-terminal domain-containing protein [Zoogloea oleivorans]
MNPALPANERGKWWSMVLAALVHAALGLFLFFGVRWQNRLPDPIEVELVSAPPPAAQLAPPPAPAPAPPVTARPKPPAPEPEDEPEPEPPPRKQPDIAIKAPEP